MILGRAREGLPAAGFRLAVLPVLALSAAVVPGGTARAQVLPTPLALAKDDFSIRLQRREGEGFVNLNANDAALFFNRARCDCQDKVRIIAELSQAGLAKRTTITEGTIRMMVGNDCLDRNTSERDKRCQELGAAKELSAFANNGFTVETSANVLVSPKSGVCESRRLDQKVWLLVDLQRDDIPDLVDANAPVLPVVVDTEPPPAPTLTDVVGGHEALVVEWTVPPVVMDLAGFQIFCSRGEDMPVFSVGTFKDVLYETRVGVCGGTPVPVTLPAPSHAADGGVDGAAREVAPAFPAFGRLKDLDPAFVCSNHLPPTQTSSRISILQNGIPYLVGVASVDKHGNASPLASLRLQTPVASRDFYNGYCEARRDAGLQAGDDCPSGCAQVPPGPPSRSHIGAAVLALAGLLAGARARRRARARSGRCR